MHSTEAGPAPTLSMRAPAKVNLVLKVLDRRPDGYHNIWSLMQTVAVEDELVFRLRPRASALTLQCDDSTLPTDGRNLVAQAATLALERAGRTVGLEVRITKRIPVSAGLGGGSSNAAATIVAINQLLNLGWSADEMARLSQPLGSDVPFFFFAPTALVRGRGEEVTARRIEGRRWVVLVNPGFPIETRWAYDQLAAKRGKSALLPQSLQHLTGSGTLVWDDIIPLMDNDFETALTPIHGVLREIKQGLLAEGAEAALLSGSGATVVGLFRDEASAIRAQNTVGAARGFRSFTALTSTHS